MRFIVYMAVMIASVITCSAAKFSYRFSSVALSDALAQIHEDHPGLKINFIYNDLENYKTSSIVKTDNPYDEKGGRFRKCYFLVSQKQPRRFNGNKEGS